MFAGVFTLEELTDIKGSIDADAALYKSKIAELRKFIRSPEEIEAERQNFMTVASTVTKEQLLKADFDVKRSTLKVFLDRIDVNIDEGWVQLSGQIPALRVDLATGQFC
jgi:hypothetical protein